ncbi:MAG: dihydrodipicolinate synthase family protein [Rubrobacter sp.]
MRPDLVLRGVVPANLMAFDADLEIDERNYRRHIRYLVDTPGVSGITTNAHASEVATLTFEEQQRVLDVTLDEVAGSVPVVCGVYEDGTSKAAGLAKMAERQGADCLLVFPSTVYDFGHGLRPEMAYGHIAQVAEATSLPIVVFVYPVTSGLHIPTDSLVKICDEIDNVIAVKEWSNDIGVYERNYRALGSLDKEISLLSSFSKSLLASLCVGADGILSGHGSVVADLHVEMFDAVNRGDLEGARRVAERIYPVVQATYAEPFLDGHNRMKEALVALGRMDEAHVRPPLRRIPERERKEIRRVVTEAGLPEASTVGGRG